MFKKLNHKLTFDKITESKKVLSNKELSNLPFSDSYSTLMESIKFIESLIEEDVSIKKDRKIVLEDYKEIFTGLAGLYILSETIDHEVWNIYLEDYKEELDIILENTDIEFKQLVNDISNDVRSDNPHMDLIKDRFKKVKGYFENDLNEWIISEGIVGFDITTVDVDNNDYLNEASHDDVYNRLSQLQNDLDSKDNSVKFNPFLHMFNIAHRSNDQLGIDDEYENKPMERFKKYIFVSHQDPRTKEAIDNLRSLLNDVNPEFNELKLAYHNFENRFKESISRYNRAAVNRRTKLDGNFHILYDMFKGLAGYLLIDVIIPQSWKDDSKYAEKFGNLTPEARAKFDSLKDAILSNRLTSDIISQINNELYVKVNGVIEGMKDNINIHRVRRLFEEFKDRFRKILSINNMMMKENVIHDKYDNSENEYSSLSGVPEVKYGVEVNTLYEMVGVEADIESVDVFTMILDESFRTTDRGYVDLDFSAIDKILGVDDKKAKALRKDAEIRRLAYAEIERLDVIARKKDNKNYVEPAKVGKLKKFIDKFFLFGRRGEKETAEMREVLNQPEGTAPNVPTGDNNQTPPTNPPVDNNTPPADSNNDQPRAESPDRQN